MRTLTDTQAAYLAGMIEGDGSFFTRQRKAGLPQPCVTIQQLRPAIPLWIHEITGIGNLVRPSKGGLRWVVKGPGAASVAGVVLPYLIQKRKEAELIIEMASLSKDKRGHYVSDELREQGNLIHQELQNLHTHKKAA